MDDSSENLLWIIGGSMIVLILCTIGIWIYTLHLKCQRQRQRQQHDGNQIILYDIDEDSRFVPLNVSV